MTGGHPGSVAVTVSGSTARPQTSAVEPRRLRTAHAGAVDLLTVLDRGPAARGGSGDQAEVSGAEHCLAAVGDVQFSEHVLDMSLDGVDGHVELGGNLCIALP